MNKNKLQFQILSSFKRKALREISKKFKLKKKLVLRFNELKFLKNLLKFVEFS